MVEQSDCSPAFRPELLGHQGQRLQSESLNIPGGVDVPWQYQATPPAMECPLFKGHFLAVTTTWSGTILGRVGRIHSPELPASFCRFARENREEPSPRRVVQGPIYGPVRRHFRRFQVFGEDEPVGIDKIFCCFIEKVRSQRHDSFVDPGHDLFLLFSLRGSFLMERQTPLGLSQPLGRLFSILGVGNEVSRGVGQKILESKVNSNRERIFGEDLRLDVIAGKTYEPLPAGVSTNGAGLDLSLNRPVNHDRDFSNPGESKNIADERKPGLRKGEGVVPVFAFESGESGVFPGLESSKEVLIGPVNPPGHVLQDLGVDSSQAGIPFPHFGEVVLLLGVVERHFVGVVDLDSFFEEFVIEAPTLFECMRQQGLLEFRGIKAKLECLLHI